MKIAFWNIRGLNHPLKQNGVKHFPVSNNVDVVAILEMKLKPESIGSLMKS
jgi:exonuclease III